MLLLLESSGIGVAAESRAKDGEADTFLDSSGTTQSGSTSVEVSGARSTPAAGGKASEQNFIWPGSNAGVHDCHSRMIATPASIHACIPVRSWCDTTASRCDTCVRPGSMVNFTICLYCTVRHKCGWIESLPAPTIA